jgi:hypothetical protein
MVFIVHIRMAETIISELQAKNLKIGRKSFIFGNIFPDLLIPHVPKHRKINSQDFFDRTHNKIYNRQRKNSMKIHIWDSFLLGVLSHYAADYSCTAHKKDYNENMRAHMRHERELSRYLKRNPGMLAENGALTAYKSRCHASQLGLRDTDSAFDELIEAMDAVRLVCGSAVLV